MNFLAPAAALFALALPVVVVFYLLKRKRVVKLVSSTLLWQKFLAETQASAPFQKLRHNWLLILQLLLLALAVLALMRPYFKGNSRETNLRVLILDGSASMQATDETPSRFERARAEALKWVDGIRDGEQMMVLLAGATTAVKQSPTGDKTALRRALQACEVSDAPTRLADALKTAGAFTFEKRGEETIASGEIHLFSDGAAQDLEEVANKNLPLIYHRVGQSRMNAGIVRIDVRANPDDRAQRAILAGLGNFATNEVKGDLELLFDGQLVETRAITLPATNTEAFIFSVPQSRDGVFTLRLKIEDDLEADNEASVVSTMPVPVKVLMVSRGNRFLEKAIRGAANVQLSTTSRLTDSAKGFDVVVLDDSLPTVLPEANILAIHTIGTNWFPGWDIAKAPVIVDWKSAHPLLRFVNFDNVQISEAFSVKPPSWGVPLVESPQTPLILVGELDQRRIVWVGFDPLQSTWPLRVSFPIFMANAVDWLNPVGGGAIRSLVRAGDPFRVSIGEDIAFVDVTAPQAGAYRLAATSSSREILVGDTHQQGVYKVRAGTNEVTFCVNLMDANESNIQPREELPLGKYGSVAATTVKRANMELWRWIALGVLAILLFEWWWYHKRTV